MTRHDGRSADELRPVTLERNVNPYAEGSCRVSMGETVVLCTASVEDRGPSWRKGTGLGWVTAEYAMLPRATHDRTNRERNGPGGRTSEIQRLIGRSLRQAISSFEFGERTIRVDCDVLQADGGTRTASITGACVALADACGWLAEEFQIESPFKCLVAAVSVGVVNGTPVLDLCYHEDKDAEVDSNIVMLEPDKLVEIQGTAEGAPFERKTLDRMMDLAEKGIGELFTQQRETLVR
ncbi:MAG: ribonuclease PH [Gemmatimonadota bacterium]|nr:ribonuclease PH [Gemmatimonadota bacterium]